MKKKIPPAVHDKPRHYEELQDPGYAAEFLNSCLDLALEENDPELLLLAIYDVAKARGMKKVADVAKLHRVSLHRMLNKGGNPEWRSLFRILRATQLRFRFEPLLERAA